MTKDALADRIITYSDALVAFSLFNALAFIITLAEPDIRCSIASIVGPVIAANVLVAVAISIGLVALRRFQRSLREEAEEDERVERFWRWVQAVRLGLVWLFVVLVVFGLWATTHDPACIVSA